jgi:hypothetical protein
MKNSLNIETFQRLDTEYDTQRRYDPIEDEGDLDTGAQKPQRMQMTLNAAGNLLGRLWEPIGRLKVRTRASASTTPSNSRPMPPPPRASYCTTGANRRKELP